LLDLTIGSYGCIIYYSLFVEKMRASGDLQRSLSKKARNTWIYPDCLKETKNGFLFAKERIVADVRLGG
jgi:hypothetical protein